MPTPTYDLIASNVLSSSASSVTFSSIPSTYRDLVLIATGKSTGSGTSYPFSIYFNSDTGTNYNEVKMYGTGSTAASGFQANASQYEAFRLAGSGATNSGNAIIQVLDYSVSGRQKTTLSRSNAPEGSVWAEAFNWANTAAITSLQIAPYYGADSIASGSTFYLYGIVS